MSWGGSSGGMVMGSVCRRWLCGDGHLLTAVQAGGLLEAVLGGWAWAPWAGQAGVGVDH